MKKTAKNAFVKVIALMLVTIFILSIFSACGKKSGGEGVTETTNVTMTTEAETTTEIPTEVQTEAPTEAPTTAPTTTQPAVTVTDYNAIMYATIGLNVRSGPGTNYATIGSYNVNDEVKVTGKCSNGWYRVNYNGKEGYCSSKYLSTSKVTVTTAPAAPATSAPETTKAYTPQTQWSFPSTLNGPGSNEEKERNWKMDIYLSKHPGELCERCGKPVGTGTNGTCGHYLHQGTCPNCGATVYPNTCHYCSY